jgi:hypothetical protein
VPVNIDYNRDLLGFIVRENGISLEAWSKTTYAITELIKQPPGEGINPFTKEPMLLPNNNFLIVVENETVGLAGWEDSECIGIAGDGKKIAPYITVLCDILGAKFEAI